VLGLLILLVGAAAVYISYYAARGLPWQPTYLMSVEVPNAAELHQGDVVQIGGARVGTVRGIAAIPDGARPYARIELTIVGNPHLPADSTVTIEPLSILGEKTLVLRRGHAQRTLAPGAVLPLAQARPAVDLNDALSTFNAATVGGLQSTLTGLADGVAGRGNDINDLLASLARLLTPLRRVSDLLAAPATDLPGLITTSARLFSAVDPVASVLPQVLSNTAATFAALAAAQPALGELLDELPRSETDSTLALVSSTPALRYLRRIVVALRPAGPLLRPALSSLDVALRAGMPTLAQAISVSGPLARVASGLSRSLPPASSGLENSLAELDVTVRDVRAIDSVVGPAQEICNVLGTTLRNGGDVIGEGDAQGSWFTFLPLLTPFMFPTGSTSSATHVNEHPVESARGCVAGNEPFRPGPQLGNPPVAEMSTAHDVTAPPAAATQRARAAGLLTPPPGARVR
jgi:virulence factor Mce-like protein